MTSLRATVDVAALLPPEAASLRIFHETPLAFELRSQWASPLRLSQAVRAREDGSRPRREFVACARHVTTLPCAPRPRSEWLRGGAQGDRFYNCFYSADGTTFAAAPQDGTITIADAAGGRLRTRCEVTPHDVRWTVSCLALLPNASALLYSSLHDTLRLAPLPAPGDDHAHLKPQRTLPLGKRGSPSFATYAFAVAPGGTELVAAASDGRLIIYDIDGGTICDDWAAHEDDINSVCFASQVGAAADLIVTGSDDGLAKVFDRRTARRVVGVLPGHQAGLTSVAARGDGVHVATNAKDSTVKVWDLRRSLSSAAHAALPLAARRLPHAFDYRFESPPVRMFKKTHPVDASIATLRGHIVLRTLIRVAWSPMEGTGGRYLAAGSADGSVIVWDLLGGGTATITTGDGDDVAEDATATTPSMLGDAEGGVASATAAPSAPSSRGAHQKRPLSLSGSLGMPHTSLQGHQGLVRDIAWHPTEGVIATASWDGLVGLWGYSASGAATQATAREVRSHQRARLERGEQLTELEPRRPVTRSVAAAAAAARGGRGGGSDEEEEEGGVEVEDSSSDEGGLDDDELERDDDEDDSGGAEGGGGGPAGVAAMIAALLRRASEAADQ